MTRTPTLLPNDPKMWRKPQARVHPVADGNYEDCDWVTSIEQRACSSLPPEAPTPIRPEPTQETALERVLFPPDADFKTLTRHTVMRADDEPLLYRSLLRLLRNCEPLDGFQDKQRRGASYKQLTTVTHQASTTKMERVQWYCAAERIPLSDRHAGYLLGRLKRRAA